MVPLSSYPWRSVADECRLPRAISGHFDVSGILETSKYHGHGFMDKTKPMVTHIV